MFTAFISVCASLSPFFLSSEEAVVRLLFPAPPPELGVLISGVGWMETGVCFKLRAWRPEQVEDAPCWLRRVRFCTWSRQRAEMVEGLNFVIISYRFLHNVFSFES